MPVLLFASLFFTTPAPLDMPRAEAYLVTATDGSRRLEDRYRTFDLWTCRAVLGRWIDDYFRVFSLCRLDVLPPALASDASLTRVAAASHRVPADRKDAQHLRRMVEPLSPVLLPDEPSRPRQMPHPCKDVLYWHGTNTSAIVCAFLPKESPCWYLASWELAPGDAFEECLGHFEDMFLRKRAYEPVLARTMQPAESAESLRRRGKRRDALPSERALLRADVSAAVAAYPQWHATSSDSFCVLDNLPGRGFVDCLTNDLAVMRARYAATIPSPMDGSNVLAVARLYADRDDYLEAAGEELAWTAAYWSVQRREIVAFLPPSGEKELLRTMRHEAFHQYLSYACAMVPASPWFNEGYAQYFEDENDSDWRVPVDLERFEELLPALTKMDYAAFYAGSDEERRLKYRLAWSMAYFLEKGAGEVRFRPFAGLKSGYVASLLETHDMHRATAAAFGSSDRFKLFVAEWKKFWQRSM